MLVSPSTRKLLPRMDKADWSDECDMNAVGTIGELRPKKSGDYSFVVAYEVLAAPAQFYRSKILRISPRYVFVNRVARPLQVTPVMVDKNFKGPRGGRDDLSANVALKEDDILVVYRFTGNEKHQTAIRLRDVFRDEALPEVGPWTPSIPLVTSDDYNVWTRGPLGDGPAVNVSCQNTEQTIYAVISDISTSPRYRIENRSTRHAFRYLQDGIKGVEEILIKPLESHSFVWENPLEKRKILKIRPVGYQVPTDVDLSVVGQRSPMRPDGLYAEVYIDGQTRVFAAGDAPVYATDRKRAAFDDWLSSMCITFKFIGFGLSIVDGRPQEMLNMTIEDIRFTSDSGTRQCVFSVHHMQIDDMTPNALYPVVLAPIDSGFNSDKREGWLPMDGERPFVTVTFATAPPSGITVVEEFDVDLNSSVVRLNLEYVFRLLNLIYEFLPTSDEDTQIQYGVDQKDWLLTNELTIPEQIGYGGSLMYFKKWSLSAFEFHLVFDSAAEEHGDGISSILGSTIGSIVGGIAHVTPEFQFDEIVYENRFFYQYDLIYAVVWDIVLSVVGQWYKIVGSVELLGDPVGLATDIVDGFALAARQLKRDVKGKSLRKGESALTLVQTVVGAPMKSIGKVSNGLGDVLKKATDFESQEEANQPRHVPEGLLQGGVVLTKSLAYGVKGFIKEPVRGAKKDGVVGFAKGVGRGTLQLVASPFVGTLGVVEKISMSVNNTTHLLDEKSYDGPRRPPRDLSASPLKPLTDSNVITEVELHVLYAEGLPPNSNPKVVIRVYQQSPGGPARTVGKLKSSTLHHTGTPKFDQSWLLTITSPDTFIELNVYHKRKPIPKKLLGHLTLSMEDIYRDFDGVPAKILSDSKAKTRLRKRRRFNGSILDELAQSGTQILDVRDDSWRQKVNRASMINVMDEDFEDENDENELYEEDVELLSSRSIVVDPASAVPHRQIARPAARLGKRRDHLPEHSIRERHAAVVDNKQKKMHVLFF
ncbi:hypothetical protein PINS_up007458 [Pythium insidiosum]|nr:hypothetical protein PINS_up007458 [Pythium insidiosum]